MFSPELLNTPEVKAALEILAKPVPADLLAKLPDDVREVVQDFDRDYQEAVRNFKDALAAALEWVVRGQQIMSNTRDYLIAEKTRDELGLRENPKALEATNA